MLESNEVLRWFPTMQLNDSKAETVGQLRYLEGWPVHKHTSRGYGVWQCGDDIRCDLGRNTPDRWRVKVQADPVRTGLHSGHGVFNTRQPTDLD
jgi:hypothetical protein